MNDKNSEKLDERISKFIPYDQTQELLLPKNVQDYIPENHVARVISRVIDFVDMRAIEMSYDYLGAPPYHPRMMMKVLVYAYMIGIRSSRKINALLQDSLVFMYLSGRQTPDFRTICRFRSEYGDKLEEIFNQVVEICVKLGMVGGKDVFYDGTKVKANASVKNSKSKEKIEKEIEELKKEVKTILKEAKEVDEKEDMLYGNKNPYTGEGNLSPLLRKLKKIEKLEEIEKIFSEKDKEKEKEKKKRNKKKKKDKEKEEEKVNTTDSEANIMQFSDKTKKPAYNGLAAVDGKENVIVACHITDEATDHHQLVPLTEHVKLNVGTPENVGADAGLFTYTNVEYCEKEGITPYIPDNFSKVEEKKKTKKKRKSEFEHDEETDSYTCPEGRTLFFSYIQKRHDDPDLKVYKCADCSDCSQKETCTTALNRTISRDPREHYIEEMRARLKTEKGIEMKKQRSTTVEPTFGNIKHNKKFTQFLLRGKKKAGIEFLLTCIAIDIEKIHRYITAHDIDLDAVLRTAT
jgi:transposase